MDPFTILNLVNAGLGVLSHGLFIVTQILGLV